MRNLTLTLGHCWLESKRADFVQSHCWYWLLGTKWSDFDFCSQTYFYQWKGRTSFGGASLHHLQFGTYNPYQTVIHLIGSTLEAFDDDKLVPVIFFFWIFFNIKTFGFGDVVTTDQAVFSFANRPCYRLVEVLEKYCEIASSVKLSGPTSFAPVINQAIEIVKLAKSYHILLMYMFLWFNLTLHRISHGQLEDAIKTKASIVEASKYPISIIIIGVGTPHIHTFLYNI